MMRNLLWIKRITLLALLLSPLATPAQAETQTLDVEAPIAFLMDAETGAVLLDKGGREKMHPSSMTKVVLAYYLFRQIRDGQLALNDMFPVSAHAYRSTYEKGETRMFLEPNTEVSLRDLLKGIVIQSGNDACLVVSEKLAGSDRALAEKITNFAKDLGAENTHFINTMGLPDDNHYTTPRDLALISVRLIQEFGKTGGTEESQLYRLFGETEFTYNNVKQGNRNPLLYKNMGADGLKTGYSEAAGYGLVGTAVQGGRRLIVVINGCKTMNQRSQEAEKILRWGQSTFDNYTLFPAKTVQGQAMVCGGVEDYVDLVLHAPCIVTLSRGEKAALEGKVTSRVQMQEGSLVAPVDVTKPVGKLIVSMPGHQDIVGDLYPAKAVERANVVKRTFQWLLRQCGIGKKPTPPKGQ